MCLGNLSPFQQLGARLEFDRVQHVQQAFVGVRRKLGQSVAGARLRATRRHVPLSAPGRVVPWPAWSLEHKVRDGRMREATARSLFQSHVTTPQVPGGKSAMHSEHWVPGASLFRMETPARRYEEFAAECERLAKEAREERHRSVLLEMAEAWRRLAQGPARKKQ